MLPERRFKAETQWIGHGVEAEDGALTASHPLTTNAKVWALHSVVQRVGATRTHLTC